MSARQTSKCIEKLQAVLQKSQQHTDKISQCSTRVVFLVQSQVNRLLLLPSLKVADDILIHFGVTKQKL